MRELTSGSSKATVSSPRDSKEYSSAVDRLRGADQQWTTVMVYGVAAMAGWVMSCLSDQILMQRGPEGVVDKLINNKPDSSFSLSKTARTCSFEVFFGCFC